MDNLEKNDQDLQSEQYYAFPIKEIEMKIRTKKNNFLKNSFVDKRNSMNIATSVLQSKKSND
jgi:hypothetical protein